MIAPYHQITRESESPWALASGGTDATGHKPLGNLVGGASADRVGTGVIDISGLTVTGPRAIRTRFAAHDDSNELYSIESPASEAYHRLDLSIIAPNLIVTPTFDY